jgi:hypothetical protein
VLCGFGWFFVFDLVGTLKHIFWPLLRPGGRLCIATLGTFFEPMWKEFRRVVKDVRPNLDVPVPWDRTAEPDALHTILADAGVPNHTVLQETVTLTLTRPSDDWWQIATATGIQRWIDELGETDSRIVRSACDEYIRQHDIRTLKLGVNYTLAKHLAI